MIDINKTTSIINEYKKHFPMHWEVEKYKWEAIKHFQDNWDIDAPDFAKMFECATEKAGNLLTSRNVYPAGVILEFAKADSIMTKAMFRMLFEESSDLVYRINSFRYKAADMVKKYGNGRWKNHYQSTNYISTYLWLMYPDKYYIYKYENFKKVSKLLNDSWCPKANGATENVTRGFQMYDEIRAVLQNDNEFQQMLRAALTDDCYPDPQMNTAVIDFGFFIAKYYDEKIIIESDSNNSPSSTKAFYPKNNPSLYSKEAFVKDVFLPESEYDKLRALLLRKKNIILQGAPGVGKTYSAKRLAYSIMGEKNDNRICMVQFHQNYSYEDFIMGYRPSGNGEFALQSGVFYDFCESCKADPDKPYFFIIDEINRGNLSKIFGELLMLIEADKRGEEHKLNLVYGGTTFYIPENLYIIGTMNTADRSLAMIDYALRRRFSFYTMQPAFEDAEKNGFDQYMQGIQCALYHKVVAKIKELNHAIRKDNSLGKGFEIGHSYFISDKDKNEVIDDEWVRNVVEFEIIPLIEEYWFDNDAEAEKWTRTLRQTIGE